MKDLILALFATAGSLLAFGAVLVFYGSLLGVMAASAYWVFQFLT
jgi:disulfide bond formation protein DsbB